MTYRRFAIFPGWVVSTYDGARHFIDGGKLIELYGLDVRDCYIVRSDVLGYKDNPYPEALPLFPLRDGKYKEHLLQIKVEHFQRYIQARKLLVHHTSGTSIRRSALRRVAAERQERIINRWERQWPDFSVAYSRMKK